MIDAITGKVGSGKSLKFTHGAARHLVNGGCVCTNLDFDRKALALYTWKRGHRFCNSQYVRLPMETDPVFHRYMKQADKGSRNKVIVGIDEAHLFFPAAEYSRLRKEFLSVESFVSQSRRVHCDITFITQAWDNVWGQLRKQALFEYECRDFRVIELPMVGDSLGSLFGLKWTQRDTETRAALTTGKTPISKELFQLYNTNQAYNEEMAEIMRIMERYQRGRVGVPFLQRLFSRPDLTEFENVE